MKWICLTVDEQLDIKELSLSYPAKSRLSPVKLENELEIEQIKWETLAVGRQIIWLYGQGWEPWTQILCNYDYCSSGQSRTSTSKYLILERVGVGVGVGVGVHWDYVNPPSKQSCRHVVCFFERSTPIPPAESFNFLSWLNEPSLPTCTCIKFWRPVALCSNGCSLFFLGGVPPLLIIRKFL